MKEIKPHKKRLPGLDLARGLTVILMVVYHLLFDLKNFFHIQIPYGSLLFLFGPEIIGGLFLGISGFTHALNFQKATPKKALQILSIALLITAGTLLFSEGKYIFFGILHCIGVSLLLSRFFKNFTSGWILGASLFLLISGFAWFQFYAHTSYFLIPFGGAIQTRSFMMLDYFPLIPYFGEFLLGLWFGLCFVKKRKEVLSLKSPSFQNPVFRPLLFLGRHSLWVYLLHQPLLLGVLSVFFS